MKVTLAVTAGPHVGQTFAFEQHDTFLVGRGDDAHCRLADDLHLSRRHFLIEFNPPLVRLLDLDSKGGTKVNGRRVGRADLAHGDAVEAGGSTFTVQVERGSAHDSDATLDPLDDRGTHVQKLGPQAPGLPVVPGYTLRREIGRGGMGVVYEATHIADGSTVAVKTLVPAVSPTRQAVERFLREARILKELHHPHVVGFRDLGEVHRMLWFAMEYVDGDNAADRVKKAGPLDIGAACAVARQLLDALTYAHAKKFVHRDIKPHNLLLAAGPRGEPFAKLSDFGLARTYQASQLSGLTLADDSGGTPLYMAPEQVTHFRDVEPPADQYGAAATLYFLLCGKPIYDPSGDYLRVMLRVMNDEPVSLIERRADVPAALAAAIHRALARRPDERFPDVHAFARALAPFAT